MIYVVGAINLDYVAHIKKLPSPGETVLGTHFAKTPGGKGANQALAALRAGADVTLIGCVGRDQDALQSLALLKEDGVRLDDIMQGTAPTGVALIQIDSSGENMISVLPGANAELTPEFIEARLSNLSQSDFLLVQQEIPQQASMAALRAAERSGATSILNIAPVVVDSADLVTAASIVVANETEFQQVSGNQPTELAAQAWCDRTGTRLVITLGERGALMVGFGDFVQVRPPKISPVDTVGAGDTFVGYFAACLASGLSPFESLSTAVSASSIACQSSGAQTAMPWLSSLPQFQD